MASIKKRKNKFCVIYYYKDKDGNKKQKWETYDSKAQAQRRQKEIEFKEQMGTFTVPNCKTLKELLKEYVELYGKEVWALSTYSGNVALIKNYILPIIGNTKLCDINTRFIEKYYQTLLQTKAVDTQLCGAQQETVSALTVRDVHKLLHSCFKQAVKWELMDRNPTEYATVPKAKENKREIWTAEMLMHALEVCENEQFELFMSVAFAGSLRLGEDLGLTWDCVDISEEAIAENRAYIFIDKEVQRISKEALEALEAKDVILVFPTNRKNNKTVRVLKRPKTESSIRKVFIPNSVANKLIKLKEKQDELKELLGDEYVDYNLVFTTSTGMPLGNSYIRDCLNKIIEEHNLPKVVFHSLRHTSVTYKLKLNGGDIKAVQGDSGHSQVNMVTNVYSHIIDEDRRKNAELFEEAFYGKKDLNPQMHGNLQANGNVVTVPEGVDAETLMKVLANPEMTALLAALAKSMPAG